jgi:hypothetical protein
MRGTIEGTRRHSEALLSGTQQHSAALSSTQRHSAALSSTQQHSAALSSTQQHSAALSVLDHGERDQLLGFDLTRQVTEQSEGGGLALSLRALLGRQPLGS